MKISAIYNEFNIDSVLSAYLIMMMVENMNAEDDFQTIDKKKTTLELIHTQRELKKIPSDMDLVYVLGVNLQEEDVKILEESNTAIKVFSYIGAPIYKLTKSSNKQITPITDSANLEESFNNSICNMLAYHHNDEYNLMRLSTELKELTAGTCQYINLKTMCKRELYLVFNHYDQIINIVSSGNFASMLMRNGIGTDDEMFFQNVMQSNRLQYVRKIISRNMDMHIFGNSSKSKVLPTFNISQEYTKDALRLIKFAHQSAVVYEDIKSYRLWQILADTMPDALEIANMIPHTDAWFDNNILVLKSHLPAFAK